MKQTTHYKGHRWTNDEIKLLIKKWADGDSLKDICETLNCTKTSILKQIQKIRKNGIPLARRRNGHQLGVVNRNWTQGEVEYLLRRRNDKATSEEIGNELDRTPNSVDGMIQKLRTNGIDVKMRGSGVRRLWDIESLKVLTTQEQLNA